MLGQLVLPMSPRADGITASWQKVPSCLKGVIVSDFSSNQQLLTPILLLTEGDEVNNRSACELCLQKKKSYFKNKHTHCSFCLR